MIPKIKKILYATDLTENSAYAFRYAVNSATKHDADVYILHVLEIPAFPFPFPGEEGWGTPSSGSQYVKNLEKYTAEQITRARKEIESRLREFCGQELQGNADLLKQIVSIDVIEGDPAVQILQKVDELKPDLVVMGTHGKGRLAHAFLGSEAEKVLHRIKIPVLIVPIPKEIQRKEKRV